MVKLLKRVIKKTPFYDPLCKLTDWLRERRERREIIEWKAKGKPVPPPAVIKQLTLKSYAKRFGLKVLIETGTYYGDMVEAMKKSFDHVFSIELSDELYKKATERFKGVECIELIHGDSSIELGNILKRISQPALFWLDGHYSDGVTARGDKDTPICEELAHILSAEDKGHVIIIDDARFFGTDPAYPSIEELTAFIRSKRPDTNFAIQHDSIRVTPKR
jgi:hypothetical protein